MSLNRAVAVSLVLCLVSASLAYGGSGEHISMFERPSERIGPQLTGSSATSSNTDVASSHIVRESDSFLVSVTVESSWNASTLEAYLCGNLSTASSPDTFVLTAEFDVPYVTVPECFWSYISTIRSFNFYKAILHGNSTYPSPYDRLAQNPITGFVCYRCVMLDPEGSSIQPAWDILFAPQLRFVSFTDMNVTQLPGSIPPHVQQFSLPSCSLTGNIPESLLDTTNYESFTLDLSNNDLSGSIPYDLFKNFPSTIKSLYIDLSGNQFTHVSFPMVLPSFPALTIFELDLSENVIQTPIDDLLPAGLFAQTPPGLDLTILINSNKFTGSVPTWWFSVCLNATRCSFSLANNLLSGTLPSRFFPLSLSGSNFRLTDLKIDLSGNNLTGGIPGELFDLTLLNASASTKSWAVAFRNNQLNGTIGSVIFNYINWDKVTSASFDFSSNQLTGSLPGSLLSGSTASALTSFTLAFNKNPSLSGSIPPAFFTSLTPDDASAKLSYCIMKVELSDTLLTGALDFPSLGSRSSNISMRIFAANANFSSMSFHISAADWLPYLDITDNNRLAGTLPSFLFASTSKLATLLADNTALHDQMPDLGTLAAPSLTRLRLGNTTINFCSSPRSTWASSTLGECNLIGTSAANCNANYPAICFMAAPVAPVAEPNAQVPIAPPVASQPTGCLASTRPSPEFICIGNMWTFIGTVTSPVLTLPAGSTSKVVGNVTSPSIVITGLQSTLIVEGCVTNLSTVTVVLTPEELEKIGSGSTTVPLIYYNSSDTSCTSNLDGVKIVPLVKGSTCRKVVARPQQSSGSLSALFTVDNGKCRVWWIVLVSVICAVVIIAVIITIVVVTHFKAAKNLEYKKQLQS